MGTIRRNADRMTSIVADLLTLSRLETSGVSTRAVRLPAMGMERVDLATVTSDAMRVLEPRARARGLALDSALPSDLPAVAGDPALID